jgi:hypothetical protein
MSVFEIHNNIVWCPCGNKMQCLRAFFADAVLRCENTQLPRRVGMRKRVAMQNTLPGNRNLQHHNVLLALQKIALSESTLRWRYFAIQKHSAWKTDVHCGTCLPTTMNNTMLEIEIHNNTVWCRWIKKIHYRRSLFADAVERSKNTPDGRMECTTLPCCMLQWRTLCQHFKLTVTECGVAVGKKFTVSERSLQMPLCQMRALHLEDWFITGRSRLISQCCSCL